MAFNPERLSLLVEPIGGVGIRFFGYKTDDVEGDLVAADYFARGRDSGMRASDLLFISPEAGATDPYILVVDNVDDEGNATAVLGDSLALGGYATESEATGGVVSNKTMSPLRAKQLVDYERTQARSFTAAQTFTTASSGTTGIKLESTAADAIGGPQLDFVRTSASPAANDVGGVIRFRGMNSAAAEFSYGNINSTILDTTAGSEDGRLILQVPVAGAQTYAVSIANGVIVGAPTGSYQGTGTINATGYYLNGVALPSFNADGGFTISTTATTQNYLPSGTFGGAWKAAHVLSSSDTALFSGQRSTLAIARSVTGSGGNNPLGDYSLWVVSSNDDLDGTVAGEVGAIRFANFGNKVGDKAGILGSSYKHKGDGTITEGANLAFEFASVQFQNNNISDQTFSHHILGAYLTNPAHQILGAQKMIGYYSTNHKGSLFSHVMGVDDNSNVGDGTAEYAMSFHRKLNTTSKYFSVAAGTGHIEAVDNTAGAGGGEWRRTRNKGAGVSGDVLWHDVYGGRNDANAAMDYVSVSGLIDTATAASERGLYLVKVAINGVLTDQFGARNGLYAGAPTGGAQGTGTLNLAAALLINANTVIDANRHLRLRSYTVATLPSASPAGMIIYVSDGTANKRLAVSDATNWRFPDGNIVS